MKKSSVERPCTTFVVSKEFPIPFSGRRENPIIDGDTAREFFESAKEFKDKKGCYVFALRAGRGCTPYYVGKTNCNFEQEVFQPHKVAYYAGVLATKKGTPVIIFVTPEDTLGACPGRVIDEVETYLIRKGMKKNPNLCNKRKVAPVGWNIKGVKNSRPGQPTREEAAFKRMMRI